MVRCGVRCDFFGTIEFFAKTQRKKKSNKMKGRKKKKEGSAKKKRKKLRIENGKRVKMFNL